MLITESLFLLVRRDDGKPEIDMAKRHYGLTAAVITDLVLAGRIALSDDKDPRMTVVVPAPPGHPVLDAGLERLQKRDGKRLSSLVLDTKVAVEERIAAAMVTSGVVGLEEKRALGLVPAKYPALDPEPERAVRERLRAVLHGATPEPHDAALLAILHGLGVAPKVLADEMGELAKGQVEERIEAVAGDVKAGDAIAKAIAAMNTAIMAAVVVPIVVSSGGS